MRTYGRYVIGPYLTPLWEISVKQGAPVHEIVPAVLPEAIHVELTNKRRHVVVLEVHLQGILRECPCLGTNNKPVRQVYPDYRAKHAKG